MQRSILTRSILFVAVAAIGFALPPHARAENTGSLRRIINVETHGNGDTHFVLEGWTCSAIRDFMYVPVTLVAADKVLSILLAAFLSRRRVLVDFSRSANGTQCNLEGIILQ